MMALLVQGGADPALGDATTSPADLIPPEASPAARATAEALLRSAVGRHKAGLN
jgi:hypothetical protein